MHLLIPAEDSTQPLRDEWRRACPDRPIDDAPGGLLAVKDLPRAAPSVPLPPLAFARQLLPEARFVAASSIRAFADQLFDAVVPVFPDQQPWRLHVEPCFGQGTAGRHRCELIAEALRERLRRQRRHLLRRCEDSTSPFTRETSLAQLLLVAPDQGFLSVSPGPQPSLLRAVLSPFPKGDIPVASDKAAPCRAFAKLVEAELRLGRPIGRDETCVDLGASPGSWTYVALNRGARVMAVDRAALRPDLMRHARLHFHQGDAFAFEPPATVDWLLCDVIAAPTRSIDLVLLWVRRRWCRHFVVTIKFKGTSEYPVLDRLKADLPALTEDWRLTRLCANKNEVCVMGSVPPAPTQE